MSWNGRSPAPRYRTIHARFAPHWDTLPRFGAWIRAVCADFAPCPEWGFALERAAIEAMSNIIRHGFDLPLPDAVSQGPARDSAADGRIGVTFRYRDDRVTLDLLDNGPRPPDYLAAANMQVFDFVPDRREAIPEGGMGAVIIRRSVDGWSFHRRLRTNRLRLFKQLEMAA